MSRAVPIPADEPQPSTVAHEDWIAVAIGVAILLLVILGVRPGVPRFGWGTAGELWTNVLTGANLLRWIQLGLLLLIPAAVGGRMMGASVASFVGGFAALYGVAGFAQILAGFEGSSALGLEYVIYALAIGLVLGQTTRLRRRLVEAVRAE
jgi:hypothetical protein